MADVAVAVDGDSRDVEDRADHTQSHNKPAQLAVQGAHCPVVMEDSDQSQGVGVQRHHQVSHRKTHHKDVTC